MEGGWGSVGVGCRLVVGGFNDQFQEFHTYAGAIRRSGPRPANAVVSDNQYFGLLSFDVNNVPDDGVTFKEFRA